MRLFDSHCHLQDARLLPAVDDVVRRAAAAGVERMLCCGSAGDDWNDVLGVSERYPAVIPALGLHPWYVAERSPRWLETLRALLELSGASIGEIGLDHWREPVDEEAQEEVFVAQLALAAELGRPVSIHCLKAWGKMMEILQTRKLPAAGMVFHSYAGPVELVEPLAELGAYFSFSGSITREGNKRGHKAVAAVPWDRLLVETDSPDLKPVFAEKAPDSPNEPANLVHVAAMVAKLRAASVEEVAARTRQNAVRLFAAGA